MKEKKIRVERLGKITLYFYPEQIEEAAKRVKSLLEQGFEEQEQNIQPRGQSFIQFTKKG